MASIVMASCSTADTSNANAPGTANAAIENIMTRCSVRQYTDQPVAQATLDTLLRAGMAAPTAANSQPWEFVVVNQPAVKDSLVAALPYGKPVENATVAIVVCGNMERTLEAEGRDYWIQDCSAATENILLAAHAVGLGAVWCGVYPQADRVKGVSKALNLPSNLVPLNVIAIGYPAGDNKVKDKWQPDRVHYNAF